MELYNLKNAVLYELNQPNISIDNVTKAIREFKAGKLVYGESKIEDVVIHSAALLFDVSVDAIKGDKRYRPLAYARKFISKYLLDHYIFANADEEVGKLLNRNRTTIFHANKSLNNLLEFDKYVQDKWKTYIDNIAALTATEVA